MFGKALPFRKELAIGPVRVMWLECNADFVTLTVPLWQCSKCVNVCCVNAFGWTLTLTPFILVAV